MNPETWIKKDDTRIEVEAVLVDESNVESVATWCRGTLVTEIDPEHPEETQYGINVQTPTGYARASLGAYVIKFGTNFFTYRIRVFEEIYMPKSRTAPHPESTGDTRKRLGFGDTTSSWRQI